MSQRASYFKLGLFVLAGTALLLVSLSLLGAGALLRRTLPAETYFSESVEGLTVGAPVKLRGVTVGKASGITFVDRRYDLDGTAMEDTTTGAWVMVTMSFEIGRRHGDAFVEQLQRMVEQGLRVRTASAGLTGGTYLDLFFPGAGAPPPLKPLWTPETLYIPSAPSLFGQIESAAERIARQLEQADIAELLQNFNQLLVHIDQKVGELNVPEIQSSAVAMLDNLKDSSERLKGILSDPRIEQIVGDVASVTSALHVAVGDQPGDLAAFIKDLPQVTGRLRDTLAEIEGVLEDEQTKRMLANLSRASDSLPGATEDIRLLARRLEVLVASQEQNLVAIVTVLRQTLENAEAITEDARRNPARILFGDPPPRIDPAGGIGGR